MVNKLSGRPPYWREVCCTVFLESVSTSKDTNYLGRGKVGKSFEVGNYYTRGRCRSHCRLQEQDAILTPS